MKQKILSSENRSGIVEAINTALQLGWYVKLVTSNEYGWIAVMEKP